MGKYTIYAGDERPPFITGQTLEKGSGQTAVAQGSKKIVYAIRPGDVGFPNMTEAWGVRLDKDGKVPTTPIAVTDTLNYTGKIKWLKWGEQGGCAIMARWLSGYNTLDYQYQKLVLKADDKLKDSFEEAFISLRTGLNEFDETNDALKIEHLKIHNINRDSSSKNPEFVYSMYFEKSDEEVAEKSSKTIDSKFDAIGIVKEAAKDNSLHSLKNLKTAVSKLISTDVTDENIYQTLLNLADTKPEDFLGHIQEHKKFISNIFVKAEAYKLLDLTKNGMIAAGKDSKELIGQNIPAKGNAMLDWLLAHCFEHDANNTIFSLKEITDKQK